MKKTAFFGTALLCVMIFTGCSLSPTAGGKSYALVYGISQYNPLYSEGFSVNLVYPNDDAVSVSELLEKKGYEVTLRLDQEGSKEMLLYDLSSYASLMTPDDTFVFYFAGHGVQSDIEGLPETELESASSDSYDEWLLFSDSLVYEGPFVTEILSDQALQDDELNTLFSKLPADRKIILIDACNSGGFIGQGADIDGISQDYDEEESTKLFSRSFSLYFRTPGSGYDVSSGEAIVLSAAGEREFSWESSTLGHGVFTYYLLQSSLYGDTDKNGYVTMTEIYSFVTRSIQENWNNVVFNDYQFHPHISGGPVDFVLFTAD